MHIFMTEIRIFFLLYTIISVTDFCTNDVINIRTLPHFNEVKAQNSACPKDKITGIYCLLKIQNGCAILFQILS